MTKPSQLERDSDITFSPLPVIRKIDGRKIKTINDVQLLFSAIALGVADTNEHYKQLEHLLEDEDKQGEHDESTRFI